MYYSPLLFQLRIQSSWTTVHTQAKSFLKNLCACREQRYSYPSASRDFVGLRPPTSLAGWLLRPAGFTCLFLRETRPGAQVFCTPGYLIYAYKKLFRNGPDRVATIPGIIARARRSQCGILHKEQRTGIVRNDKEVATRKACGIPVLTGGAG